MRMSDEVDRAELSVRTMRWLESGSSGRNSTAQYRGPSRTNFLRDNFIDFAQRAASYRNADAEPDRKSAEPRVNDRRSQASGRPHRKEGCDRSIHRGVWAFDGWKEQNSQYAQDCDDRQCRRDPMTGGVKAHHLRFPIARAPFLGACPCD